MYAGNQHVGQTVLLFHRFHGLSVDIHPNHGIKDGISQSECDNNQRGKHQFPGISKNLGDIYQGKHGCYTGNHEAGIQEPTQGVEILNFGGQFTGTELFEKVRRQRNDTGHNSCLNRNAHLCADTLVYQIFNGRNQLCADIDTDREDNHGPEQSHTAAGNDFLKQQMRNSGSKHSHQGSKTDHSHCSCIIRSRNAFQNIAHQNRDAELFHGERLIEAKGFCFQLLSNLLVDRNPSAGSGVYIMIAAKSVWNQCYLTAILCGSKVCTHSIFVPVFFQSDRTPHNAIGAAKIFQLIRKTLYALRKFSGL